MSKCRSLLAVQNRLVFQMSAFPREQQGQSRELLQHPPEPLLPPVLQKVQIFPGRTWQVPFPEAHLELQQPTLGQSQAWS